MAAQRKIESQTVHAAAPSPFEEMVDPLHPMHQDLMRRVSLSGVPASSSSWSRSARMAAVFYMGLAAWGLVALAAWAVVAIV